MKSLLSALLVAVSFAAPAFAASDVVTIYAADGLHDGKGSWFETQFDDFTKATGIKVQSDGGDDSYQPLVNNFQNFIYNSAELKDPPKTFDDLLGSKFKGKIQYSTPGQAGDGTAVMLQVVHAFGSKDAAFDYLKKLQDNNVGPSASTGKLTALVNKGELFVANGDLQMNMSQQA